MRSIFTPLIRKPRKSPSSDYWPPFSSRSTDRAHYDGLDGKNGGIDIQTVTISLAEDGLARPAAKWLYLQGYPWTGRPGVTRLTSALIACWSNFGNCFLHFSAITFWKSRASVPGW